ncbi:MAG TPA: hypothetical protein DIS62_01325 [Candidatus Kerfeldbacteria bacterium]|nr:hypothetical protein [Candidatus Kerfeldbacteria bacterium]
MIPMFITTRKARHEDSQAIAHLLYAHYSFSSEQEANETFQREYALHYHFRVAESEGRIVGIVSWRMHGLMKHGIIKLKRAAVSLEAQQWEDVLEVLFDAALADADWYYRTHGTALRKVYTVIPKNHDPMHVFLQEKGMELEAVLRDHYYQGRDEYLYSLFLNQPQNFKALLSSTGA